MIAPSRHLHFHATTVVCILGLLLSSVCCEISYSQQSANAAKPPAPTAPKVFTHTEPAARTKQTGSKSAKATAKKKQIAADGAAGDDNSIKLPLVKHIVSVFGSFEALNPVHQTIDAQVVAGDLSISSDAKATLIDKSQVKVTYSALSNAPQPTLVYLADIAFPFIVAKSQEASPLRRLIVSGDFCRALPDLDGDIICGSGLLPNPNETSADIKGYVYGADGAGYTTIKVNRLTSHSADIEFETDPSLHPAWIVFQAADSHNSLATFPYIQASPDVATDAVYMSTDIDCDASKQTTCPTPESLESLSPDIAQKIDLLSVHGNIFFTRSLLKNSESVRCCCVFG